MSSIFAKPKILAIGGAGIKIASRLKAGPLADFDMLGIDLISSQAPFEVVAMGGGTLGLLGSGGDPEVARNAAEGQMPALEAKLADANLIFIIAGLGGGTASALAPMVAQAASKAGNIVASFVTLPFTIEGNRRATQAREALAALRASASVVVPLPNDMLLQSNPETTPSSQVMELSDPTIARGIKGFTSMLCSHGILEVDFSTLQKIFASHKGKSIFALGEGVGAQNIADLIIQLTSFPLLRSTEVSRHTDHLILSIKASADIGIKEINEFSTQLAEKLGCRGERLIAATIEPEWKERIEAMLIGLPDPETRKKQVAAVQAAARAAKGKTPANAQTELGFNTLLDQRGFFESSEPNLYRGEDVDLPTYLRRGVKLLS